MLACVLLPPTLPDASQRLLTVSPVVELAGEAAFVDVRGTERLHGGTPGLCAALARALLPARPGGMGLAGNRFTAEMAARVSQRLARGAVTVEPGDEALFLSRLPVSLLPLSPGLARRLAPLGLETLGDLASLPLAAVSRRFGPEGVAMHALARGEDEARLLPEAQGPPLTVLHEPLDPVPDLERLAGPLEQGLTSLCAGLAERGLGVVRLTLELTLDDQGDREDGEGGAPGGDGERSADRAGGEGGAGGADHADAEADAGADAAADAAADAPRQRWALAPAEPETRVELLRDLILLALSERPPRRAVLRLALTADEVAAPGVHQNSLLGEVSRDAARRAEALSRLAGTLGPEVLARPVLRRAHRTEDRWVDAATDGAAGDADGGADGTGSGSPAGAGRKTRARKRAGSPRAHAAPTPGGPPLRWCDPPRLLVPIRASGRLIAFRLGRRELTLAALSPPRRLEGGWWCDAWARDEYDLVTTEGAIYRICRDMAARRWLLLAEAD